MKRTGTLILLTFLLSGCSMEYKLNIDENMIMEEEIIIFESDSKLSSFTLDKQSFIDDTIDSYASDQRYSYYTYNKRSEGNYHFGTAKTSYLDFENFKNKNTLKDYFFSSVSIVKNKNIATLDFVSKTTNELLKDTSNDVASLEFAKITISIPFKVIENNADSVDKKNGSYTWNYSKDIQEKSIHLVFDTSKKQIKINIPTWAYVLGGILGTITGITLYIYYRYRKNSIL